MLDGREADKIALSSISLIEIVYLSEKRRVPAETLKELHALMARPGSRLVEVPIDHHIADSLAAIPREQVPDMADRIIAATALHLGVPLVSRDGKIRASFISTVW